MTADNKDNIFITDYGNPNFAVKEFTTNGTFIRSFGTLGIGPGQFINPGGVGTGPQGNIYVTDFGENNNVQKFDPNGHFLESFGTYGSGNGQFINPTGRKG